MVKTIGNDGMLDLGRKFVGRSFDVTEREDGTLVLVPVASAHESEAWAHTPEMQEKPGRARQWCAEHSPAETDLDELMAQVRDRL